MSVRVAEDKKSLSLDLPQGPARFSRYLAGSIINRY